VCLTAGDVTTLAGTVHSRSSTPSTVNGIGTNAVFGQPRGIAVDSFGFVYVVDSGNSYIQQINAVNGTSGKRGLVNSCLTTV
jgi:hypothetical protein